MPSGKKLLLPSLFWLAERRRTLVVSEPLDGDLGHWTEVPPNHFLVARRGAPVRVTRFEV